MIKHLKTLFFFKRKVIKGIFKVGFNINLVWRTDHQLHSTVHALYISNTYRLHNKHFYTLKKTTLCENCLCFFPLACQWHAVVTAAALDCVALWHCRPEPRCRSRDALWASEHLLFIAYLKAIKSFLLSPFQVTSVSSWLAQPEKRYQ